MDFDKEFKKGQNIALVLGIIWMLFIISAVSFMLYVLYKWLLGQINGFKTQIKDVSESYI